MSRRTFARRWEKHDTATHPVGAPTLHKEGAEDLLVQLATDQAIARNGCSPAEFRGALREVATQLQKVACGGSASHLRGVERRHRLFHPRIAERTTSTRALGMTRFRYAVLLANLDRAGIKNIPPRKAVNVDEANVFVSHGKVCVMAPGSATLKHLSARDADVSVHISIVVAVRADGLPYGKPIFRESPIWAWGRICRLLRHSLTRRRSDKGDLGGLLQVLGEHRRGR